jgi:hypothetical protein
MQRMRVQRVAKEITMFYVLGRFLLNRCAVGGLERKTLTGKGLPEVHSGFSLCITNIAASPAQVEREAQEEG